jgi:putative membrane-bound dehydrogenase-like protein
VNLSVTHGVLGVLVLAGICGGCGRAPAPTAPPPFTPDVQAFVDLHVKTGGDKLTSWMQGQTTSPPDVALQAFEPIEGFTVELVASEPVIRQPIDLHFDTRGRLWVVQYLQYPFPAGLTITSYDQYLRASFDTVPAAPPDHVRGADRITVLEDTNGDGVFDSHQDVITGLNITTSVLTGRGGVWVMNPPYLLFYPDRTGDGLPDGNPEVRLEGFGLEDTHSLANSLTWGPDGWLYGVHGSTSTARVRGLTFLGQAVWRYHPDTDAFELFAEGGGNPWTLSFDSAGRAFSGDNGGNSRGFHWVRGGRYQKNWPKHGPFTRPHAYGHFANMAHEGDAARFAMTSVVYEDGRLPGYEGQLIAGMALTSRIQASRLVADGSTFRTVDTDTLVRTPDRSFRPVDMTVGPDGAVYIADWCDIRMDHTDPRDTWDKSCGRIWRLRADGAPPAAPFNLAERSSRELVSLLGDDRKWYREAARRLLGERREHALVPELRRLARDRRGHLALEALWTANLIAGTDPAWAIALLDHPDAAVRAWTLRLLSPREVTTPPMHDRLIGLARTEPDVEVRSELAATAGQLLPDTALAVLQELIRRNDGADKHIPLRIWWALEEAIARDADLVLTWIERANLWDAPLFTRHLAGRIARRFAADRGDSPAYTRNGPPEPWTEFARHPRRLVPGGSGDYVDWQTNYTPAISDRSLTRLARLLELAPRAHRDALLTGVRDGLAQGEAPAQIPERFRAVVTRWWDDGDRTPPLVEVATRLGHPEAAAQERAMAAHGVAAASGGTGGAASHADAGEEAFLIHCAPCHQVDGRGMARLAPPLRDSAWVLGDPALLARIVLNGLQGEMLMPAMRGLDDEPLAAILTYVRGAWGHDGAPVSPETIGRVRAGTAARATAWTAPELTALAARE